MDTISRPKYRFAKVDVDAEPSLADRFGVAAPAKAVA